MNKRYIEDLKDMRYGCIMQRDKYNFFNETEKCEYTYWNGKYHALDDAIKIILSYEGSK